MPRAKDVEMGDRAHVTVYSPSFLTFFYDAYVLGFNMRCIWGAATSSVLVPFFTSNFSRNHLDIGVATGYLLAKTLGCPWRRNTKQELSLLDIGAGPLKAAESRVLSVTTATNTHTVQADVTREIPASLQNAKFDSIAMMNLFHCVPGGSEKFNAIKTYKELLADDGVLSGCTVLGIKHSTSWLVSLYLKWYNDWWGVFNNWDDTRDDIETVLRSEFEDVETTLIGMMLLFRATKPYKSPRDLLV